jgi:hypothetical protein
MHPAESLQLVSASQRGPVNIRCSESGQQFQRIGAALPCQAPSTLTFPQGLWHRAAVAACAPSFGILWTSCLMTSQSTLAAVMPRSNSATVTYWITPLRPNTPDNLQRVQNQLARIFTNFHVCGPTPRPFFDCCIGCQSAKRWYSNWLMCSPEKSALQRRQNMSSRCCSSHASSSTALLLVESRTRTDNYFKERLRCSDSSRHVGFAAWLRSSQWQASQYSSMDK